MINRRPMAGALVRLIEEFNKLPGIGPKTAQRLAYHVIRTPSEDASGLAQAILSVKESIAMCRDCFNISEAELCPVCSDPGRDRTRLCIVEEPLDVQALEKTKSFDGLYHVLHGVISPMNGVGPDDLKIGPLLERVSANDVEEVILATNPNVEGEATSMYIHGLLQPLGLTVTRPARGLPAGSDLEYADEVTLTRAIQGRQEF